MALRHLPGLAFFDSSGNFSSRDADPVSILTARPVEILRGTLSQDLPKLRQTLAPYQVSAPDCGFPLGAACGTIDYDGSFEFGFYPDMLVYAHRSQQWFEVGALADELRPQAPPPCLLTGPWEASFQREEFLAAVRKVQDYIAAGDIYQVNVSQRFQTPLPPEADLAELYLRLRDSSPAPMAAWLRTETREILSSSPETFLRMHGRALESRPIKGTRPRFRDPENDSRSAFELKTSEKELAELVMITDLIRNDLGKVSEFGSVSVLDLCRHERLEQVHHLVSTVTGQLSGECDQLDALQALFPGGSITGAPKKRAIEIIAELEPIPRGLYTGAIGYLGFNGDSQLNIAIRTLVRDFPRNLLSYHVGAGIVADSQPEEEYRETLLKAEGIKQAMRNEH
jgi:para-aminobenzoate synthetase component 1